MNKTTIRWQYSQRRGKTCKGAITTASQIQRVVHRTPHGHDADNITVSATKGRTEFDAAARSIRSTPGQLLADQASELSVDVCAAMGGTDCIKHALRPDKPLVAVATKVGVIGNRL